MVRVLLLIALIWLLYIVIKRAFLDPHSNQQSQQQAKSEEKMVQCSVCGMHVPESESLTTNNAVTCNNPDCNKLP